MKTFFPIAVAFVLSVVAAQRSPPIDEKDSYGDYLHGKNGYNPGWELQKKRDKQKQLNDAYNKKLDEREKEEKARKAARAASTSKGKKGK
ncbi:hypothetical protein DFJ73DRAFT_806289 [Zopfochytrium polystomum]|nr:hypothetical protein DFJ73DRAFT_806289 [Zopfochytrium polystomum]